ncbi:hypothetical protein IDJ77_01775 [Mucilaginibacter sp. ZT4R22]|uniref:Uncharacterized protein n=1 Tax=Mucilaginibacter pankratovii TaxID=2772110 RepID=A0ABR7WK35_9SPHI|nr:hypothetical protein [Mucilaginibacter pankratovii]MBD1362526.1 hypothetical protein [Mucilaginibacter pankratovii]
MWRKIHSNRDPRDTLYSEIRKEFGTYFQIAGHAGLNLFKSYPKFFYGCMIALMTISLVLSFTVFRHPEKAVAVPKQEVNPVADGFSQIIQATGNIRQTLHLKKLVDSLSAKQQLTAADSLRLDSALDQLSKIHQTLK